MIGTDYNQNWLIISKLHSHRLLDCVALLVTLCAGQYLSTCVILRDFFQHSSRVVVLQLSLMQGAIHSHLVVIGLCKKIWDPDWLRIYCGMGATQGLILDLWIKTKKWVLGYVWTHEKQNETKQICRLLTDFLFFFYLIFTTVGTQTSTSLSLGCGKQGSVCPCVRRVHYQANPSPSVLSTSPKVYSRAGRATQRKASFFSPSWLEAKGQCYLRLWLLCSFCLAPPIEDRKWAWKELNTAPSRFSSRCGGYSHRKVKLSDKEKQ